MKRVTIISDQSSVRRLPPRSQKSRIAHHGSLSHSQYVENDEEKKKVDSLSPYILFPGCLMRSRRLLYINIHSTDFRQ